MRQARPCVWFSAMQPRQLGDRERCDRHEADSCRPFSRTTRKLFAQPPCVSRGLGVVPQLRGAQDFTIGIERDHAMLLARNTDADDLGCACLGERYRVGLLERTPPRQRILLRSRRRGCRVRRSGPSDHSTTVNLAQLDLGALRRRIDPRNNLHVQRPVNLGCRFSM